ncbi:YjbH domain-containing protein [Thiomicrorhabdus heinhorstiae]|uniref:YjbH domain-containing protein n=1 Tax=Thiomicrorhabdus heinhorstiae TaxID=2748010 RepID=A0ABS0BU10_9GAMM|nr:YjbH domain-containing protein [Thiomicrorhabdus heinhorstiae]MBF6057265.1 YjbH domain-containing protein [Thiomicrorhabdus heinhorstiae]
MKKIALFIGLLSGSVMNASAEGLPVSQTATGGVGLIEMPSARMDQDGEFGVHLSSTDPYSRVAIFAQPFPWLEALFKYTDVSNRDYGTAGSTQGYKDKSVDVKLRLLEEGYYWPEIALGMRDVGGTGLFSGEYIVASKQWHNFDFSVGIGWGYLAGREHIDNPLGLISDSFKDRNESVTTAGSFDSWRPFHGEKSALFAGLSYQISGLPLVLKFEYDANDYQNEPLGNHFNVDSPFNAAIVYRVNRFFDLQLGAVRGNTLMVGVTLKSNVLDEGSPKYLDPKPEAIQTEPTSATWPEIAKTLDVDAGYDVESIYASENKVSVIATQRDYLQDAKGIGRAGRVLNNRLPESVDKISIVESVGGMPVQSAELDRAAFVDAASLKLSAKPVLETTHLSPDPDLSEQQLVYQRESDFGYRITPELSGSYGGPDAFLLYQLSLAANATYRFRPNTWLSGGLELGLLDNYDSFNYVSPASALPRVRTDIKEYLKTSRLRLNNLQLVDAEKLASDWFAMGYIGYLESMYGGIGAEILYRPFGEDWALGVDANYVKQRDFDQRFGFRDYSVLTGHMTAYYEGFKDIAIKLSAGRYLAKDRGVTLDMSRKFQNGAKMGFWATKTNVSAEQFGEGSFDKGLYITFPFDLFTFKSTKQTADMRWQFLTRDGGQKLNRRYNLFDMTEGHDLKNTEQSFEHVLD